MVMMVGLDSMAVDGYVLDKTSKLFYNAFSNLETVYTDETRALNL